MDRCALFVDAGYALGDGALAVHGTRNRDSVPGVKLRLTKARPSRKEGVEAEMRKDLTALARNHSVTDVIIVSAEEDLARAIAEVLEFGVRAVLVHLGAD